MTMTVHRLVSMSLEIVSYYFCGYLIPIVIIFQLLQFHNNFRITINKHYNTNSLLSYIQNSSVHVTEYTRVRVRVCTYERVRECTCTGVKAGYCGIAVVTRPGRVAKKLQS